MPFGEELRAERERRGISLDEVAVSTRISLRHLHALESDQFRELPGGVFNRGIVRSYAQCCGLNGEEALEGFTRALRDSGIQTETRDDDWVEFAEAVRRSRTTGQRSNRMRWLGVLAMVVAVLLLAGGVFYALVRRGVLHVPHHTRSAVLARPAGDRVAATGAERVE